MNVVVVATHLANYKLLIEGKKKTIKWCQNTKNALPQTDEFRSALIVRTTPQTASWIKKKCAICRDNLREYCETLQRVVPESRNHLWQRQAKAVEDIAA